MKALPKMAKAASSDELKHGFEEHFEQTRGHVGRLEKIFKSLGASPNVKEQLMASPASIKKHPIHAVWQTVAIYCIAGGIVGALLAAVPGLIDYFSIDEAEMKRIANLHLAVNLGALVIFAINLCLRFRLPEWLIEISRQGHPRITGEAGWPHNLLSEFLL